MDRQPIISAKDVEITFSLRGRKLNAIRKCSLDLYDGETLAIVGESGSGKSVFTKTFVGMLDANGSITGGSILFEGRDMTKFTEKDWLGVRGKKIAMVMQDPMTSLNPLKKIGKQIQESIEHHQGLKGEAARRRPSRCWPRSASLTRSAAMTSTPTSFPAVCASVSSSPLQRLAARRC